LFVTVVAYNELSCKMALGPLFINYTLWEDPVVRGVVYAPRLPLDSQFFTIGCLGDFANSWEEPGSRKW
jgi:hypothetical protein